jgi:hypothetical protein
MTDLRYGPWSPTCPAGERERQLRCLAGIAACQLGSGHPIIAALRAAESNTMAYVDALDAMERMPALWRRRLLATHAAVTWPRQRRGGGDR